MSELMKKFNTVENYVGNALPTLFGELTAALKGRRAKLLERQAAIRDEQDRMYATQLAIWTIRHALDRIADTDQPYVKLVAPQASQLNPAWSGDGIPVKPVDPPPPHARFYEALTRLLADLKIVTTTVQLVDGRSVLAIELGATDHAILEDP